MGTIRDLLSQPDLSQGAGVGADWHTAELRIGRWVQDGILATKGTGRCFFFSGNDAIFSGDETQYFEMVNSGKIKNP